MQRSEICCTCLKTNVVLINIRETDSNNAKWSYKLNYCVPEVIWCEEENLICQQCVEHLEVACAFRELCLRSYALRQEQESERILQESIKLEEVTVEEEDLTVKIETDDYEKLPLIQESGATHREFVKAKDINLNEYMLQELKSNTKPCTGGKIVNKSYLRDLLQTPQEFFKTKNYISNKDYSKYMENTGSENLQLSLNVQTQQDAIETENYISDEDDVQCLGETSETTLSRLRDLLQTPRKVTVRTEEMDTTKSCETKTYNLHEDGIEFVEEKTNAKTESDDSSKSLLRDLLLTPKECLKLKKKCLLEDDNFQYVEVKANAAATSGDSNLVHLPDPLETQQVLVSNKRENLKCYFDSRVSRLPDNPRTNDYQCKHCTVKFGDRRSLTRHNKDFHQLIRPWDCLYCNKSFKTHPELKQHEKSHLNQRKYECSTCGRSYNTTSILAKHKIIKHTSSKEWKYTCPHCNQKYPFKAYRDQHIRRNHTNAGNEYVCFHCNAQFSNKLLLVAHIRYKHNPMKHVKQCQICQCVYVSQVELENHLLQKHNIETVKFPKKTKKYKCDKCCRLYTTVKAKNFHYAKCDGIRRHIKKNKDVELILPLKNV